MKTNDIEVALKDVIERGIRLPASHENDKAPTPDRPYLIVKIEARTNTNPTVQGGPVLRQTGTLVVTVVVDEGSYVKTASEHADAVAALYPMGPLTDIPNGQITITATPDIKPGFNAGAEWRVPILIRYLANRTT